MQGTIVSYRRGKRTQKPNQVLIKVDAVDTRKKAEDLIGKKVIWKSPAKKELSGEISAPHGGKGIVRAKFETGMPGQSLGSKVDIK